MRSESLQVTSKTTLQELQQFASKLDDGMRLRARKVEGGYELYAKDSKPGLWSRITGRSAETRANARAAVNTVLANTERNIGGRTLDNVRLVLNSGIRSRDVKGDALKELARAADRSVIALSNDSSIRVLDNRGPGLDKFPENFKSELLDRARETLAEKLQEGMTGIDDLADELAKALEPVFKKMSKDASNEKLLTRLALSSGSAFKYDLRNELAKTGVVQNNDSLRILLDCVFKPLMPQLLPHEQDSNGAIKIGNDTYTRVKTLGKGGFGTVDLYECNGKKIALKTLDLSDDPQEAAIQLENFKREANVHRAGVGGGHDNVIGFLGAVRMNDDSIAIALEYAPHGDATNASKKIDAAVQNGTLTLQEATAMKLTLLKDMAEGLNHLQRTGKEIVHFDFKNENVFIGADGKAKVGDFGLSAKQGRFDLAASDIPDAETQLPPELSLAKDKMRLAERSSDLKQQVNLEASVIAKRFKNLSEEQKTNLFNDVKAAAKMNARRGEAGVDVSGVDSWALGNAAFRMIFGRGLFSSQWKNHESKRIQNFGSDANNRAIDTTKADGIRQDWGSQQDGAFAGSAGNADIDDLLNRLLHPDPAQRMTVGEALQHRAFSLPGVGDKATRNKLLTVL